MFLIAEFIAFFFANEDLILNHFFCIGSRKAQQRLRQSYLHPNQVHTESSGLARTLQSAYALHAGLFPLGSVPSRVPGVYVPVPVYSRPTGRDLGVV